VRVPEGAPAAGCRIGIAFQDAILFCFPPGGMGFIYLLLSMFPDNGSFRLCEQNVKFIKIQLMDC
ncbi:MAG: hypothetical protein ACI3XR_05605, partial [Eubacteriales bacterium]